MPCVSEAEVKANLPNAAMVVENVFLSLKSMSHSSRCDAAQVTELIGELKTILADKFKFVAFLSSRK